MFEGHQFIKLINDTWVLDLTEYTGYKVKVSQDNKVEEYKEAFTITVANNEVSIEKNMRVPIKVLREATNIIMKHQKEYEEFQQRRSFYVWAI